MANLDKLSSRCLAVGSGALLLIGLGLLIESYLDRGSRWADIAG